MKALLYSQKTTRFLQTFLLLILMSVSSFAATKIAIVSGNWNNHSTWGGSAPNSSDDVIISAGVTLTINNNSAKCKTLKINNIIPGTATLSFSTNSKLVVSGIVTLSGLISNSNGEISMSTNSSLECDGFSAGSGSYTINPGTGTIQINTSGNIPSVNLYNLIINSGTATLVSNINVAGDITINTSASLNSNSKKITLNGTTTQTITGNLTAYDFEMNNTATSNSLTLSSPLTINNSLIFTDGIINATSFAVVLSSTATAIGASNISHVNGNVTKTTNSTSSFTFPTGNGTIYRPIGIISPSNDTWTARYYQTPFGNNRLTKQTDSPVIHHVSNLEYWNLTPNSLSSSARIEASWGLNSDVLNPKTTVIAHWNASSNYWENLGTVAIDTISQTLTSTNSWNTFSPFTLGSTVGDESLPIELLYVESKCGQEGLVNVEWATATEENNEFFSVYRSNDGITWKSIAKIPGSGNSKDVKKYNFIDEKPTDHDTYYKIGQVDYNGQKEDFDIMSIYCLYNHKHITFTPIPAENYINFEFYNEHHIIDILTVRIYNQRGQLVSTQYFNSESDENSHKIQFPDDMTVGTYFVQVKLGGNEFYSTSFVKK